MRANATGGGETVTDSSLLQAADAGPSAGVSASSTGDEIMLAQVAAPPRPSVLDRNRPVGETPLTKFLNGIFNGPSADRAPEPNRVELRRSLSGSDVDARIPPSLGRVITGQQVAGQGLAQYLQDRAALFTEDGALTFTTVRDGDPANTHDRVFVGVRVPLERLLFEVSQEKGLFSGTVSDDAEVLHGITFGEFQEVYEIAARINRPGTTDADISRLGRIYQMKLSGLENRFIRGMNDFVQQQRADAGLPPLGAPGAGGGAAPALAPFQTTFTLRPEAPSRHTRINPDPEEIDSGDFFGEPLIFDPNANTGAASTGISDGGTRAQAQGQDQPDDQNPEAQNAGDADNRTDSDAPHVTPEAWQNVESESGKPLIETEKAILEGVFERYGVTDPTTRQEIAHHVVNGERALIDLPANDPRGRIVLEDGWYWHEVDIPTETMENPEDLAAYFEPKPALFFQQEFRQRNGLGPVQFKPVAHDKFSHMLQGSNERNFFDEANPMHGEGYNLSSAVDFIVKWYPPPHATEAQIIKREKQIYDKLIEFGIEDKTISFIYDQIDYHANLNSRSRRVSMISGRAKFIEVLKYAPNQLVFQRPTHVPLQVQPN